MNEGIKLSKIILSIDNQLIGSYEETGITYKN